MPPGGSLPVAQGHTLELGLRAAEPAGFLPGVRAAGDDSFVIRFLWPVLAAWITAGSWVDARVHVVARGDSLSEIAERYRVRIEDLRAWNHLEDDTIVVGRPLALDAAEAHAHTPGHHARSESVGAPSSGSLEGGVRLTGHPGYVLRDPERAYGTQRTIDRLRAGFDAILRGDPIAPRVRVHDLSLPGGGPIDDHHTHRSGRDVDITYFQRSGCRARQARRFGGGSRRRDTRSAGST